MVWTITKGDDNIDMYHCHCGAEMCVEEEYNPETDTFTCLNCGAKSPTLINIKRSD